MRKRRVDGPRDAAPGATTPRRAAGAPPPVVARTLRPIARPIGNRATGRLVDNGLWRPLAEGARGVGMGRFLSGPVTATPESTLTAARAAASDGSPRAPASDIHPDSRPSRVHRHASWEHKMLGDVDPDALEIIASGRDVAHEEQKRKSFWTKTQQSAKTISDDRGREISLDTVLHTMDQEIRRLKYFQSSPPTGTVADATTALQKLDADDRKTQLGEDLGDDEREAAEQEIDDAQWDVRLVELTLKDGNSFLVTYGELNTLADFYGSAKDIAQTPADNFRGIVGGVREESLRKWMRLRNELTVTGEKPYDPDAKEHHFEGAIGNKGTTEEDTGSVTAWGAKKVGVDAYGELKLMGEVKGGEGDEERAKVDGREETSYMAGLARNACHFAPQSWHAWGSAHTKAEALAREAFAETQQARELDDQEALLRRVALFGPAPELVDDIERRRTEAKKQAAAKLNDALIENGFADHFLQDSYAAGHLINKTVIMQWFAKWLDAHGRKRDYSTEEQWRQIQQMAYGQSGIGGTDLYDQSEIGEKQSNDPQSVENMEGDWTDRFSALGLDIPGVLKTAGTDEWEIFVWWQAEAAWGGQETMDSKDVLKTGPIKDKGRVKAALKKLIDDGVIYYKWYSTADRAKGAETIGVGTKSLRIKKEYIPDKSKRDSFFSVVREARGARPSSYATGAYVKMAKAVTYGDYHNFLNHGYLQLSTNVLHDYFCLNGLDVATKSGDTPFKIYGDNAMLGRESAKGVKYSAQTSRMSRDAIYELGTTGETTNTTQAIAGRFPTYVRPSGSSENLSLADWHGESGALHKFCFDTVFDGAAALFSKSTVAAKAKLAGQVSKDDVPAVHSGEGF